MVNYTLTIVSAHGLPVIVPTANPLAYWIGAGAVAYSSGAALTITMPVYSTMDNDDGATYSCDGVMTSNQPTIVSSGTSYIVAITNLSASTTITWTTFKQVTICPCCGETDTMRYCATDNGNGLVCMSCGYSNFETDQAFTET